MRTSLTPASQPHHWTVPDEATHRAPEFVEINTGESGGGRAAIQFDARLEPVGWQAAGFDDRPGLQP